MYRLALTFALLMSGCFSDDYCNDTVAGAPSCTYPDSDPETPTATVQPVQLGDRQKSTRIAAGGAADLHLQTTHLTDLTVSFRDEPLVVTPQGEWRVTRVRAGDALEVSARHATTDASFAERVPLPAAEVAEVVLAPHGPYARQHDNVPLYHVDTVLVVQLRSVDGDRLVDRSVRGDETVEQIASDLLRPPPTAGIHHVRLAADSFGERVIDVSMVDVIDRLEASRHAGRTCFHAMLDTREMFATWTVSVDGVDVEMNGGNCATAPASAMVVARAGGLALTLAP